MSKIINIIRNKRNLLFIVFWGILFLLCVVPLLSGLYGDCYNDIEVESLQSETLPISSPIISQQIILQGRMKNLGIYFVTSNTANTGGKIKISLEQGSTYAEEIMDTSKIKTSDFYYFTSHLSYFKSGNALVKIQALNSAANSSVSCVVSHTLVSGLPAALENNKVLGGPLVLKYNIFKFNFYFYYDSILLFLLLCILIITSYLLIYKRELLDKHNILFLCSFSIIFLTVSIKNPNVSVFGDPISEAAYEFWQKAHYLGFFHSLMSLMSGESMAWLERIFISISDFLSPSGKYVFTIAQFLELSFISAVTSMVCLKSFKRYFSDEIRLLFSIFVGSLLYFNYAYNFNCSSYWGTFFFIVFALMNLKSLKKYQYILGVVLAGILCLSRIFYIVLVPICIFLLIVDGKKLGRRFRILCYTIIACSSFQSIYSVCTNACLSNESFLSNIKDKGILAVIGNTFYYQVQVFNSLFTNHANINGLLSNLLYLTLFLFLICYSCYHLFKDRDKKLSSCVVALILFGLGTILIDVLTSGNWLAIAFPNNYSAKVDWNKNYFQQADFHFSFAYTSACFLGMAILYYLKSNFAARLQEFKSPVDAEKVKNTVQKIGCTCFAFVILFLGSQTANLSETMRYVPTEWKKVYKVTHQSSYYIPINVSYPVASINLSHNSYDMIFAYSQANKFIYWKDGDPQYSSDIVYNKAVIGNISNIGSMNVLSLSVLKANTNFETTYIAVFYDQSGKELTRVTQSNSTDRAYINFMLDKPLKNVYSVSLITTDGLPVYVKDAMQFGISEYK